MEFEGTGNLTPDISDTDTTDAAGITGKYPYPESPAQTQPEASPIRTELPAVSEKSFLRNVSCLLPVCTSSLYAIFPSPAYSRRALSRKSRAGTEKQAI